MTNLNTKRIVSDLKVLIKHLMLSIVTIAALFIYSVCNAEVLKSGTDSTGITPVPNLVPGMVHEKRYLLDSGYLSGRPSPGNRYWSGDPHVITNKRCAVDYAPVVALAFVNSNDGGGDFGGTIYLNAALNVNNYTLFNIMAYTLQGTRNGIVTLRWDLQCVSTT